VGRDSNSFLAPLRRKWRVRMPWARHFLVNLEENREMKTQWRGGLYLCGACLRGRESRARKDEVTSALGEKQFSGIWLEVFES